MGKHVERVRAATVLSVCGLLLPLVAACQSPAPIVAPAYMERPKAQIVGPQKVDASPVAQKRDTGTYPTFAKPMTAALPQMESEEAGTMETTMSRLGLARRKGQISEAEYKRKVAELRALEEGQKPVATPAASQ
ncbi:hypothetical protein RMR16_007415 [Agrobacterium sp. rho-13.3]|jgi:hypothetical protein|uniref:hypothetical protein n=1 Tax=Agrobacterium sp. rho-13.3 TaxID=3072980 RepID=UPI002A0CB2E8|nr:hypothetical protein [Agrobacterium sp. rho-13.3]MDX8311385.1 hypothetical protein [Agrobacterium sp. rho-13.3]